MTTWVAKLIICARHLYDGLSMNKVSSLDLPDLTTLNVKGGSGLEVVTMRELLQHSSIVLRIVAGDVSNLYINN